MIPSGIITFLCDLGTCFADQSSLGGDGAGCFVFYGWWLISGVFTEEEIPFEHMLVGVGVQQCFGKV